MTFPLNSVSADSFLFPAQTEKKNDSIENIQGLCGVVQSFPSNSDEENWNDNHYRKWSRGYPLFSLPERRYDIDWSSIFSLPNEVSDDPDYKNFNTDPYSDGYASNPLSDYRTPEVRYASYDRYGTYVEGCGLKRSHDSYNFRSECICPKKLRAGDSTCQQCNRRNSSR